METCPACGAAVSGKATACPKCGHPGPFGTGRKLFHGIWSVFVFIGIIAATLLVVAALSKFVSR